MKENDKRKTGNGTGKVWINNEIKNLRVPEDDVDMYLEDGWVLGRTKYDIKERDKYNLSDRPRNRYKARKEVEYQSSAIWFDGYKGSKINR